MSHNRPPPQTPASSFCFIVTLLIALFNPPGAAIFLCFQIFKEGDCQKLKRPQCFPNNLKAWLTIVYFMSITSVMKIDKEQIRNVSLCSLNASEKRNVKIMVSRGDKNGDNSCMTSTCGWKKGKYFLKKGLMLWPVLENKIGQLIQAQQIELNLNVFWHE